MENDFECTLDIEVEYVHACSGHKHIRTDEVDFHSAHDVYIEIATKGTNLARKVKVIHLYSA